MRTLSNNFQAAAQQVQTSEAFLELLHVQVFENNGTTTDLYFVNNKVDVTSNAQIYTAASFELNLTSDGPDAVPTTSLRFDSGDQQIIRKLREVDARPEINMSIVLASNPDNLEIGPINYEVESFSISDTVVEMQLTVEPILNEPIASDFYTPTLFSGLWGSVTIS